VPLAGPGSHSNPSKGLYPSSFDGSRTVSSFQGGEGGEGGEGGKGNCTVRYLVRVWLQGNAANAGTAESDCILTLYCIGNAIFAL